MAQFNLPQNSKIEVGKYFKDKTNSRNLRKVNVYRWDPSTGKNPRVDTFEVDMDSCGPKVLDVLFKQLIEKNQQKQIVLLKIPMLKNPKTKSRNGAGNTLTIKGSARPYER